MKPPKLFSINRVGDLIEILDSFLRLTIIKKLKPYKRKFIERIIMNSNNFIIKINKCKDNTKA